jgi:hypothetical protein
MTRTAILLAILLFGACFLFSTNAQAAPKANLTMVYYYFDG